MKACSLLLALSCLLSIAHAQTPTTKPKPAPVTAPRVLAKHSQSIGRKFVERSKPDVLPVAPKPQPTLKQK